MSPIKITRLAVSVMVGDPSKKILTDIAERKKKTIVQFAGKKQTFRFHEE